MVNYFELIQTPRKFFKSVEEEPVARTLKRIVIPILVLGIVSSLLSNKLLTAFYEYLNQPLPTSFSATISAIISILISIFIISALFQLSLKILKVKAQLKQTVKTIVYPSVFVSAVSILLYLIILITPIALARLILHIIISFALGIWFVILIVIGLSELHKISIGKAVGTYFLSIAILIGILVIIGLITTTSFFILK